MGVLATFDHAPATAIDAFTAVGDEIRAQFRDAGGLMVVRGLAALEEAPEQLVRISQVFGPEVEDYRETLTSARFFHQEVPEILVLSNRPPCNHPPPPRPEPALTAAGGLPVQFPHQPNWHTDQSYRRPPPDVSLLFGVITPPPAVTGSRMRPPVPATLPSRTIAAEAPSPHPAVPVSSPR